MELHKHELARHGTFLFSGKWKETIRALPETGMGYSVVTVALKDGRVFKQAVIDSGHLARIRGIADVPFKEDDITEIVATHERWDWKETP
jgi:hypothetical protein